MSENELSRQRESVSANMAVEVRSVLQESLQHDFVFEILIRRICHSCLEIKNVVDHAMDASPLFAISL